MLVLHLLTYHINLLLLIKVVLAIAAIEYRWDLGSTRVVEPVLYDLAMRDDSLQTMIVVTLRVAPQRWLNRIQNRVLIA